jgi:hypothetical protein
MRYLVLTIASVDSGETRSKMLQADARVSDLPYPAFRTRAPHSIFRISHSSDGPSQALLPFRLAHDLVERCGGSDPIYAPLG